MQIIFIPGLLCTDLVWGDTNKLRNQHHVIDANVLTYNSVSEMANMAIDCIQSEEVALIGISMGGYVAIDAALKLGSKLKKLILISTTAKAVQADTISIRKKAIELAHANKMDKILNLCAGICFYKPTEDLLLIEKSMAKGVGCEAYIRQQNAIISRQDYMAKIASIKCETLILSGKNDKIIPYLDQIEMFQIISKSNLYILEDCGHLPTLEKSKQVMLNVEMFLAK